MNTKKRAVFFDRDGVTNELIDRGVDGIDVKGRIVRWTAPWTYEEFRLHTGVPELLEALRKQELICILVTNQPDIAYGTLSQAEHDKIMTDIRALGFDDIFVCPHGREDDCECKKPKPGMLLSAAKKWNIDLSRSFIVGDTRSDIEAGAFASCTTIIVQNGDNDGIGADIHIRTLQELSAVIRNNV